ncbi:MAG: 4-hydroxy-tetrahydrodipicolinate reductase [Candidatus Kapabacteria bacterium]|nr:4-hydroxy-tetrahydrodipicolinate reductase [Candidatus Kapabacteria bacterium]
MTRLAIIGHGAMGREIERLAEPLGMNITSIFDVDRPITAIDQAEFDVAIDFSWPDSVVDNVRAAARLNRPIVIGTTGWYGQMDEVRQIVASSAIGCVWGSNFNIGTHLFLRMVRNAAELINPHASFDVAVHEWHHHRKKDSPSGTALSTAQNILAALSRKTRIDTETQHERIDASALHVTSSRVGEVIGRHQVMIDSPFESIEIIHSAKNRQGFAQGALLSAQWIQHRTGFFDVSDIIDFLSEPTP